jgi:hypothetical protein
MWHFIATSVKFPRGVEVVFWYTFCASMPIKQPVALRVAALLLICLASIQSHSTTVVVIVDSNGIVIATDSKGVQVAGVESHKVGQSEEVKARIIKGHYVIAGIGRGAYTFTRQRLNVTDLSITYEFGAWVSKLESSLNDNASFDDLVGAVKADISYTIPQLQTFVTGGGILPSDPVNVFEPFMEYVLAGYQSGVPRVCVLQFYIDWSRKLVVDPFETSLSSGPIAGHIRTYFFGMTEAISDFTNLDSYVYKRAMAVCPKAFHNLISPAPISLDESAAIARAFVGVEEETNPNLVGGRVRLVEIIPSGKALDLTSGSPKPVARTKPQSEKKK